MELKLLEDFLALSESGSFSKAAQFRNVTQPAFSRRIRALESWLGVDLIDRSIYPMALTEAGIEFRGVARDVVQKLLESRGQIRSAHARHGPAVQFAMPHSLAISFFPSWWRRIGSGVEKCSAKVITNNYHDCVQSLIQGSCQFLLCFQHEAYPLALDPEEFPFVRIGEEWLLPVSAPNPDGTPQFAVCHAADVQVPLLGYAEDAFLGRVAASILDRHPHLTNMWRRYEDSFAAALRAEALAGAGLAWLPKGLVAADLDSGALVEAGETDHAARIEIRLYRSSRDGRPQTNAIWSLAGRSSTV